MENTIDKKQGMPPGGPRQPDAVAKASQAPESKPLVTSQSGMGSAGSSAGTVLGPDGKTAGLDEKAWTGARNVGREIRERAEDASSDLGRFVRKEPMTAALCALGAGVVVGLIVGLAIARD